PVRSSVAFTYTTAANGTALVNVYNAMGAKVQSFSATLQKGVNTIVQPLDNKLARGSYILEVVTANERSTAKLIK
ncbi:MAG TPA: T9SS type A sorting domain-containing protein, partial [Chitinophagaceae bacterium]|nr:T9SS type A sorting domain-containing protein [Chitinophagaceae bacterium]